MGLCERPLLKEWNFVRFYFHRKLNKAKIVHKSKREGINARKHFFASNQHSNILYVNSNTICCVSCKCCFSHTKMQYLLDDLKRQKKKCQNLDVWLRNICWKHNLLAFHIIITDEINSNYSQNKHKDVVCVKCIKCPCQFIRYSIVGNRQTDFMIFIHRRNR